MLIQWRRLLVDNNYSISYGVSSNNPSIQQLVNGLQFLNQAANATDETSYNSDISNALTLLSSSTTGIQALHAGVANNQNIVTNETTVQNSNITSLQNQIGNIQQVDTATVGTELTALENPSYRRLIPQPQGLEQLSLVKYLYTSNQERVLTMTSKNLPSPSRSIILPLCAALNRVPMALHLLTPI